MPQTNTTTNPGDTSILSDIYQWTATPYFPAVYSAAILSTPLISPAVKISTSDVAASGGTQGTLFKRLATKTSTVGLSTKNALLFGAANALGAYMVYDDDLEDGSGFLLAWSTLYTIVNGKSSLRAVRYGRVWPLMLTSVAVGNIGMYGVRFLTSSFTPED